MSSYPLPRAFEPDFYRQNNPDAASLTDDLALAHYRTAGIQNGLAGSAAAERGYLLSLIGPDVPALEIGPFHAPSISGRNVRYMDVLTTEQLKDAVREAGHDTSRVPEIHYPAPTGGFELVDQAFACVFSGHCIEHQPDLIRHLQGVSGILNEGGRYYIACPDKRFCFDHFAPVSGVADVVAAHHGKRTVHQPRSFIVQKIHRAHNDGKRHWDGDHGLPQYASYADPQVEICKDIPQDGLYHDTHAWQFTPESFFEIMSFLYQIGFIDLAPERVYQTRHGSQEFTAVLRKGNDQAFPEEEAFVAAESDNQRSNSLLNDRNYRHEIDHLTQELTRLQNQNEAIHQKLGIATAEISKLYTSRSWALTAPLRKVSALLGQSRR